MNVLKPLTPLIIFASLLSVPQPQSSAQEDETPEQREEMRILEEREKIAVEERAASGPQASAEDALMAAKEKERSRLMKEEERDVTESSEGDRWRYWRR